MNPAYATRMYNHGDDAPIDEGLPFLSKAGAAGSLSKRGQGVYGGGGVYGVPTLMPYYPEADSMNDKMYKQGKGVYGAGMKRSSRKKGRGVFGAGVKRKRGMGMKTIARGFMQAIEKGEKKDSHINNLKKYMSTCRNKKKRAYISKIINAI